MSITATTQWDVRTTGSDSNGGGFDPTLTGTDYSQQDTAQVAYTDLVIDGTTNTKCTSSAHAFSSAHVGNIINITSGSGFTVQRVQVLSVSGSTATCDKSLGTLSSTGGNGNLGGSLLTISTAGSAAAQFNKIHVKAGTYTVTAAINPTNAVDIIGYQTTHNDGGTKPLLTTSTNSIDLLKISVGGAANWNALRNMSLSSTAGTPGQGLNGNTAFNGTNIVVDGCSFAGFSYGIQCDAGVSGYFQRLVVNNTEISGCTVAGIDNTNSGLVFILQNSYLHGNANACHMGSGSNSMCVVERCIFASNSGYAIKIESGYCSVRNTTVYGTTGTGTSHNGSGIWINGSLVTSGIFEGNISYGNASVGFGVTSGVTLQEQSNRSNAYGSNTGGNTDSLFAVSSTDVTLTANPFTNTSTGDYSLNSTAGGGAACKGAGFPGVFPGATSTGNADIGAVQSAGSGGGGSAAQPNTFVFS
jgi:hypothetical protein